MDTLSEFDKVILLNSLTGYFPGCFVHLASSKPGQKLMFCIEMASVQDFTLIAPLGAYFSGFSRRKNRFTAILFFIDLEHYCEHYKVSLRNENVSGN